MLKAKHEPFVLLGTLGLPRTLRGTILHSFEDCELREVSGSAIREFLEIYAWLQVARAAVGGAVLLGVGFAVEAIFGVPILNAILFLVLWFITLAIWAEAWRQLPNVSTRWLIHSLRVGPLVTAGVALLLALFFQLVVFAA
jgi:hypothetical protein